MATTKILVCTVDTDVVVLAVMVAEKLQAEVQIWLAFGTGKISNTWQHTELQLL